LLGHELIEERFDDLGYSGTTLDRPALRRLLAVIRSGGIEQLVIHRLDRLSRNRRHFITLFEELRDSNVTLSVVTAPESRGFSKGFCAAESAAAPRLGSLCSSRYRSGRNPVSPRWLYSCEPHQGWDFP
jgi:DNA invertase Pin-like site-specific DNA recombinase